MNSQFSFCFTLFIILVTGRGFTSASSKVKKNVDDNENDPYEGKDMENMEIPGEIETKNVTICARRSNTHIHEITKASYQQFPFIAALMNSRDEYVCAGTVVANKLILTSADCAKSATYALVNITCAKKDDTAVVLNVIKVEPFPTNDKNVALLHTKKQNHSMIPIAISNTMDVKGTDVEAIGFGLNAEVGHPKELQYVGLEVSVVNPSIEQDSYLTCVDTKVVTCFKDKGGPMLSNDRLVGVVTEGQEDCVAEMNSKYDLNKLKVTFLPSYIFKAWLNESISKNNEDLDLLNDSTRRRGLPETEHTLTGGAILIKCSFSAFFFQVILNVL